MPTANTPTAAAVVGSLGAMTWDADGSGTTSTAQNVAKGSSYEYTEETKTEESGPYVGDSAIEENPAGDKYDVKLEMVVPQGGDVGQKALAASRRSKVRGTMVLFTVGGFQITLTGVLIKKVTIKTDAKGTQTISVEASAKDGVPADAPAS